MNDPRGLLLAGLLLAPAVFAQDQATTLLAALRSADVVVRAQVTAASDPSPDWHRRQFQTTLVLKGQAPATFAILEPAGACCGRSLFALQPADVRVFFLQRQGPTWHLFGGACGVVAADAAVVSHLQALQGATDAVNLTHVLAQALGDNELRIADDAAHALATLPQLALDAADRTAVTAALQDSLVLRGARCASLVDVAVRAADPAMIDVLLAHYLDCPRPDQTRLLRSGLLRCSGPDVQNRLPVLVDGDQRALRAAELLVAMPSAEAQAALTNLLVRATHPRLQLCIAEALLGNGARGVDLAALVPEPVLELAARRSRQPARFRNIDPNRR